VTMAFAAVVADDAKCQNFGPAVMCIAGTDGPADAPVAARATLNISSQLAGLWNFDDKNKEAAVNVVFGTFSMTGSLAFQMARWFGVGGQGIAANIFYRPPSSGPGYQFIGMIGTFDPRPVPASPSRDFGNMQVRWLPEILRDGMHSVTVYTKIAAIRMGQMFLTALNTKVPFRYVAAMPANNATGMFTYTPALLPGASSVWADMTFCSFNGGCNRYAGLLGSW